MTELRPLDEIRFQVLITPAKEIGARGELKWIALTKLFIDPTYQRAILDTGRANIRRMIEGFSWLQFGVLVVGVRDGGRYAIIDGQHRATAAKLHGGITEVPCLVIKGGARDEARAFGAINGNVTRIHTLQSFRAKVAAGDLNACELVQICGRADVTLAGYPKVELAPGETMALGAIRACIKRDSERCLTAALRVLRAADPTEGISAAAILGTSFALAQKPEWQKDAKRIGELLAKRGGAKKLTQDAQQRKLTRGGTEWSNFAVVIGNAISMALRAGDIPLSRLMGAR